MDRLIEVKVRGNFVSKDNKNAGTQGEYNVTTMRIEFDEGWDGYAKHLTFWDAYGENPVKRILTADLLENMAASTRIYAVKIPGEPLAEAGDMSFVIDGYIDGVLQRTVEDRLTVKPANSTDNAGEPADPTPSQAQQLQVQMDRVLAAMGRGEFIGPAGPQGEPFTYEDFTPEQLEALQGPAGLDGKDGSNGATFTPTVSADGTLSWTNDGGKANPAAVNIRGDKGDKGDSYELTATDKSDIASQAAELIAFVQAEEPTDAPENSLWVDTDDEIYSIMRETWTITYTDGTVEEKDVALL